jgi:hypothetical protein
MEMVAERGASVAYSDPLVDELSISDTVLRSVSVEQINQTNWDAAMVLVNAKDLPLQQLSAKGVPIFDRERGFNSLVVGKGRREPATTDLVKM